MLNQIKEFIDKRGISRYRFWQDTGLGRDTAYRLCNDRTYIPTGNVLDKICGTYRVQPGELLVWMADDDDGDQGAINELEKVRLEEPLELKPRSRKQQNPKAVLTVLSIVRETA